MSIRENVVRVVGTITAIGGVITAYQTIDTRYVHADDFKTQVMQIKDSVLDLHRARLEDEIFKLELIPKNKRTATDNALLDRYKNQIKELDRKRGTQ